MLVDLLHMLEEKKNELYIFCGSGIVVQARNHGSRGVPLDGLQESTRGHVNTRPEEHTQSAAGREGCTSAAKTMILEAFLLAEVANDLRHGLLKPKHCGLRGNSRPRGEKFGRAD